MTNAPKKHRRLTSVIFTKAMTVPSTEALKVTYDITDDEIDEIVEYHFEKYYGHLSQRFILGSENDYGVKLTPNEIRLLTLFAGVNSPIKIDWLRQIYTSGELGKKLVTVNSRYKATLFYKLGLISDMLAWDRRRDAEGFMVDTKLTQEGIDLLNARVKRFEDGTFTHTSWINDREKIAAQRAYTIYKHRYPDTPFYHNGMTVKWEDYSFRLNLTLDEFAFICHLFGERISFPTTLNMLRVQISVASKRRHGSLWEPGIDNVRSFTQRLLNKLADLNSAMNRRFRDKEILDAEKSVRVYPKINYDAQTKGVAFDPSKAFAKTSFLPGRYSTLDFLYLSEDDVSPNEFVGSLLEAYNDDRYLRGLDETKHFSDIYHY